MLLADHSYQALKSSKLPHSTYQEARARSSLAWQLAMYESLQAACAGCVQVDTSAPGTQWGTGGMVTKLTAARLATAAGCHMAICKATQPESIASVLRGEKVGTVFYPQLQSLK